MLCYYAMLYVMLCYMLLICLNNFTSTSNSDDFTDKYAEVTISTVLGNFDLWKYKPNIEFHGQAYHTNSVVIQQKRDKQAQEN